MFGVADSSNSWLSAPGGSLAYAFTHFAALSALLLPSLFPSMQRILSNIAEYPKDPKYRRVRAAKLPPAALLAPSLALLASVGFRPLLLPLGEGATAREEDVFLGLAAGEEAAEAVGLAAVVLKERLSSSAAGP